MQQPEIYDALVVGGGPAGASAAHLLAQGGARVLLLEKAAIPRYKPCGGGITARARDYSPLAAAYVPPAEATTFLLRAGERSVRAPMPSPVGMAMRSHFDAYLVDHAARAGTIVRDSCSLSALEPDGASLRVTAGRDTVLARYVIAADGANGITARLAGFPPVTSVAVALEAEIEVPEHIRARYQDTALIDFATVEHGYGWVFGKDDCLSCGVGKELKGPAKDINGSMERFLASVPGLSEGTVRLRRGHRIPLAGGRTHRVRGAVLLAGDAAALADPLSGEGISYALASGRRAGASVLAALAAGPDALAGYDAYLANILNGDLRYARLVGMGAYASPSLLLYLLQHHPQIQGLITGAVCGTIDYRSVVRRAVRGIPTLVRSSIAFRRTAQLPSA